MKINIPPVSVTAHVFTLSKTVYCDEAKKNVTILFEATGKETFGKNLFVEVGKILSNDCPLYKDCANNNRFNCRIYLGLGKWATQVVEQEMSQNHYQKKP